MSRFFVSAMACTVFQLGLSELAVAQPELPPGFEVDLIADGFSEPVALAPAPDGRLFVAERSGKIFAIDSALKADTDTGLSEPMLALVLELEVYTIGEAGLLGLETDPNFATNRQLYAFVTVSADEQQILAITVNDNAPADVRMIRGNLPTTGTVHNSGGIRIGPDGKLYFSIGDNGQPELADQLTSLAGKISRINIDGSVPDDNPFVTPTGSPRAIYAIGFRNPFRFCFDLDGRMFAVDVGSSGGERFEEINLVLPGRHYGWPEIEGFDDRIATGETVAPIHAYQDEGGAITGITAYTGDNFPVDYRGNLFHLDFVASAMFRVVLDGDTVVSHERFLTTGAGPTDIAVSSDGSIVFVEMISGSLKRLRYQDQSTNPPPDSSDPSDQSSPSDQPDDQDSIPTQPTLTSPTRMCGAGIMGALLASISFLFASLCLSKQIIQ